ncbi:hypothetical protein H5410_037115 [Solanum commersonii]|uniref:Uncharacterized protein n=1 Tax=Solanum commersonii TaxID=4109 RepID=A0A9J5Y5D9_SOLCO|nr:hypothetical protein H5410_037115 [Solanum commersonii]
MLLQLSEISYIMCSLINVMYSSFSTKCAQCHHKPAHHFLWWNRYIAKPLESIQSNTTGRDAIVLLKYKILENLLLKRTKKERAADLALPLKTISLGWTTEEELSLYKHTPTAVLDWKFGWVDMYLDDNNGQLIQFGREEIMFMFERDGSAKGILLSLFTQFLDLIQYSLQKVRYKDICLFFLSIFQSFFSCQFVTKKKLSICVFWQSDITCVQLVGSTSVSAREAAVTRFTEDLD